MASHDPFVGIELYLACVTPAVPGRQAHAKFAAAGLGIPSREPPLAAQAQFVFGHRPLQPQQQSVVDQARIVDTVMIDQERPHQSAEIDQVVPVPAVAREPRRLETEDAADCPGADAGPQPLEAGPFHQPRPRASQIFIDRLHVRESQDAGRVSERVLTSLAFEVFADLQERGLPDVRSRLALATERGVRSAVTCVTGPARRGGEALLMPRLLDNAGLPELDFVIWTSGVAEWMPRSRAAQQRRRELSRWRLVLNQWPDEVVAVPASGTSPG